MIYTTKTMDESGEQPKWSIKSSSDVTAELGTSEWNEQMKALDAYQVWSKANKTPKIDEFVSLEQADKEAHARKIKAGKLSSKNPNNPKNRATQLSTTGNYGEFKPSGDLDNWHQ